MGGSSCEEEQKSHACGWDKNFASLLCELFLERYFVRQLTQDQSEDVRDGEAEEIVVRRRFHVLVSVYYNACADVSDYSRDEYDTVDYSEQDSFRQPLRTPSTQVLL